MLEKLQLWLIKLIVGKKIIIMNVPVNGEAIKNGFSFIDTNPTKSVIRYRSTHICT